MLHGLSFVKQAYLLAILIAGSQKPRDGPSFLEAEKAQELVSVFAGVASVDSRFLQGPHFYCLPLEDVILCQ